MVPLISRSFKMTQVCALTRGVSCDEGQVEVSLRLETELALGLLSCLAQPLHGKLVVGEVDALLLLELVDHVVQQHVVEILSSEESVSIGGLHLCTRWGGGGGVLSIRNDWCIQELLG